MQKDMEQQLSSWKAALQTELAELEQQLNALRSTVAEKRAKIAAIDQLLGATAPAERIDLAASADDSGDDALSTPGTAYWQPILSVLVELGGRARRKKVIEMVGHKMKDILLPTDYSNLPSQGIRWQTRVTFQASYMRRIAGLISNDSPRGVWEITDAGRQWLAEHS